MVKKTRWKSCTHHLDVWNCRPTIVKGWFSLSLDCSFGHPFASKWWLLIIYFVFFIIPYHLLECKLVSDRFWFFFFFFFFFFFLTKILSRLYPYKAEALSVLTLKRRAKGKFHYPTAGLFSASLKMKIKIFFLLEIVRNGVKKHEMQLFPFRFHLTWTGNPLKIGSA